MEDLELFMSKDQGQLLDSEGKVIAIRKEKDGVVYYQEEGEMNAQGKKKICVGWAEKKVCVDWNDKSYCVSYGAVQYCAEYSWED